MQKSKLKTITKKLKMMVLGRGTSDQGEGVIVYP
jgi:hypothetical protein